MRDYHPGFQVVVALSLASHPYLMQLYDVFNHTRNDNLPVDNSRRDRIVPDSRYSDRFSHQTRRFLALKGRQRRAD